jgi:uroporphyrinogen decarboxylase
MRQAGRYMREYRALRERYSLLELCRTPDLATEVTLQPVRRLDVDAAILFSDLLLPLEPMGVRFDFVRGEGPAIENPITTDEDVKGLRRFEPREALGYVFEAIHQVKRELGNRIPLIGFAGAPFTLASYAIEGGHSNNFARTKTLMYARPAVWHRLAEQLSETVEQYLCAQIEAGVDAVQLFDSWVGALNARDYREFIMPHTKRIFAALSRYAVPAIHFGVGAASILPELREAGGHVIGVDWRTPVDDAWDLIGHDRAVQGNLDPALLLGPLDRVLAEVDDILDRAGGRPGHIFNLGHGILPQTPVEHVQAVAERVHRQTRHAQVL